MDLKMPDMGGVEAIRTIRAKFPSAKITVLSTFQGDEDIYRALEAGAVTYLLKDMIAEKMMTVIREVADGGRPIPSAVGQQLANRMFQAPLTDREIEVLQLVARGMRNKEIAAELKISVETVQGHLKNIFAKLSVQDRTEAVSVATRRGIVRLD
jgi:DNA-binding NarL/FixJ family response regulator